MTTGKAVGLGIAGSALIGAFGIPVLWPLGIVAALVANGIVKRRRPSTRRDDRLPQNEDTATSHGRPFTHLGNPHCYSPPQHRMDEAFHPSNQTCRSEPSLKNERYYQRHY